MDRRIKITGAAPQIGIFTLLYLVTSFILSSVSKSGFPITSNHTLLIFWGIIWIMPGIVMVMICGRKLVKSFNENTLMCDGLYRIFRNPMYGAYVLFIIPGVCLLFNSWLVLTTVPVNYILLQIFIQKEYNYLRQKFGEEYEQYLKTVIIKFL